MNLALRHRGIWYAYTCACRVPEFRLMNNLPHCMRCSRVLVVRVPRLLQKAAS